MDSSASNLENVIERILFSAKELKKKLETVRESRPENAIDYQQQSKDNRKIKELERENMELKQALEDHQYGLEFIMSKYRSQVSKLIVLNTSKGSATRLDQ